jgi:hypothetical protein
MQLAEMTRRETPSGLASAVGWLPSLRFEVNGQAGVLNGTVAVQGS